MADSSKKICVVIHKTKGYSQEIHMFRRDDISLKSVAKSANIWHENSIDDCDVIVRTMEIITPAPLILTIFSCIFLKDYANTLVPMYVREINKGRKLVSSLLAI